MADLSQVDVSQIGPPAVSGRQAEDRQIHLNAFTQIKAELNELLNAEIPPGGATGQALVKASNNDFDTRWQTVGSGGGGGGGGTSSSPERILPETYGTTGTTADVSALVQSAINAAKGQPTKVLWLTTDYYVNDLTCDSSVNIDGGGRLIPFQNTGNPVLSIINSANTSGRAISARLDTTIDLSNGDSILSNSTRLTVSSVTSLVVGDLVKIVSQDATAAVPGGANFRGRYATIISIDVGNNYVYLDGILDQTFTTNPMLYALSKRTLSQIKNISFFVDRTTAFGSDWAMDFLHIRGAVAPVVENCSFTTITTCGINLLGCIGADVSKCSFIDGRGRPDLGIASYGIQDAGGYLNKVRGNYYRNLRHSITTIDPTTTGHLTDPSYFGTTYGMIGADNVSHGASAAHYDTHSGARNCGYINCIADGGYANRDSSYSGFQLRGDQCFVVGGQVTNCEYGIVLYNQSANESVRPHVVHTFKARVRKAGFRARPTNTIFYIARDLDLESSGDRNIDLGDAQGLLLNVSSRITGTVSFAHIIQNTSANGSICKVQGGTFDSRVSTGTNGQLYTSTGTNHLVALTDGIKILTPVTQGWRAVVGTLDGADLTATFDVDADRVPANSNGTNSLGAGSVWVGRVRVNSGIVADNTIFSSTLTGANKTLTEHVNAFAEDVVCLFNCTTATTTIIAASAALMKNQRVHIINRGGSTNNLILKHDPSAKLTMVADRTLAPGAAATITWNTTDGVFNLTSSPLAGTGGINGIDIKIDGVAALTNQTFVDFEADDFDVTAGQVKIDHSVTGVPTNTWSQDQNANAKTLSAAVNKNSSDVEQTVSSSANAITLNHANGNIVRTVQSENINTITISNFPVGGWLEWWVSRTNSAHTITFPASFRFVGGVAPTLSALGNTDKFYIAKRGSLYDVSYEQGYVTI